MTSAVKRDDRRSFTFSFLLATITSVTSLANADEQISNQGFSPAPQVWSFTSSADNAMRSLPPNVPAENRSTASPQGVAPAHFMAQNRQRRGGRARFDPALVARGQTSFNTACTVCHDAQRALQKKKSLSGWRATVRRMAAKDGADVPRGDFTAIATYLASLSSPPRPEAGTSGGRNTQSDQDSGDDEPTGVNADEDRSDDADMDKEDAQAEGDDDAEDKDDAQEDEEPQDEDDAEEDEDAEEEDVDEELDFEFDEAGAEFTLSATLSTLFRGADHNHSVENEGFFVDAWVGADWQPSSGPMSARVMACTSCHSEDTSLNGEGFALELVEASATLDLIEAVCGKPSECGWDAKLKAGRFIVPFGAYAAMSHPGAYRTLTNPLMYNMGRRVFGDAGLAGPPRQPVLPMPYADEGVGLKVKVPLKPKVSAVLDLYSVNGLQQSGPDLRFFRPSRSYVDNNSLPALGGRVSLGNPTLRLGGSFMTGEAQPDGTTTGPILYQLSGADITAKFKERARFYFEYAIRTNTKKDTPFSRPAARRTMVYGVVAEAELKLCDKPRISWLGRYDTLEFRDTLFPGSLVPETGIDRYTWGFNLTLPGGSLLILNHERWKLPDPDDDIDVLGFRWVATF